VSGELEQIDISSALSGAALAVKDENELVRLFPCRDTQMVC
jgi:hypothetical protein